jgi:DNA-directed RNA polymerase specialized sigma24 family protein
MAWYPHFCAWLQDAQGSTDPADDVYLAIRATLEPIIITRFRCSGHSFYDTDVADCLDQIFDRMERRLTEPMEFRVSLARRCANPSFPLVTLAPGATHASFLFDLHEDLARAGLKAKLFASNQLTWEEDIPVHRYDPQAKAVPIQIPASCLNLEVAYLLELECTDRQQVLARKEFQVIRIKPLHLLRTGSISIIVYHLDLDPSKTYRAEFRMGQGIEIAAIPNLPCTQDNRVRLTLANDQLRHEQDTEMDICEDDDTKSSYLASLRAVRHESSASRRGFVAKMARNVAYEHFRERRNVQVCSLPAESDGPASGDECKRRVAILLAKSVIEQLPPRIRTLLVEHEVAGRSWADIAKRHKISEAKAKQDTSRALAQISKAIIAGELQARKGAVRRFVEWVKDALDEVISYGTANTNASPTAKQ